MPYFDGSDEGVKYRLEASISFTGNWLFDFPLLAVLASLDGTGGTTLWALSVDLSGGTNSTPSAAGLASKAIIVANGGTVLNN